MNLIIPFISSSEETNLRHCLRSIEKNITGINEIYLISNYRPKWLKNVNYIKHPFNRKIVLHPRAYDITSKMLRICKKNLSEHILIVHDDQYFLREVNANHFLTPRYVRFTEQEMIGFAEYGSEYQKTMLIPTIKYISKHKTNPRNYENHLPRIYVKDALLELLTNHCVLDNRLLFSSIYFNVYDENSELITKENNIRASFMGYISKDSYGSYTEKEVLEAVKGKYILNHSKHGLTEHLKKYIECQFPVKSCFEK